MRTLIPLAAAVTLAAAGCHLVFPFDVPDAGSSPSDTSSDTATSDAGSDGTPRNDGPQIKPDARADRDGGADLAPVKDIAPVTDLPPPLDQQLSPDASVLGKVSTIAGLSNTTFCTAGNSSSAATWRFMQPYDLVVQGKNIWVVDRDCNRVLLIYNESTIVVVAGTVASGYKDGNAFTAMFKYPTGVAVDAAGTTIYVADRGNRRIRKIFGGQVSTVAGTGSIGYKDGLAISAEFRGPSALALRGNKLYVADDLDCRVRVVDLSLDKVSTLAGSGCGSPSFQDGKALSARFSWPSGLAVDAAGTSVYVSDGSSNNRIRRVYQGKVSTVAGSGITGFANGAPLQAQFNAQAGIAIDGANKIYVADRNNFRIRLVAAQVTTLAGTGVQGQVDGPRLSAARFSRPLGVALDKPSAPTVVYVADAEGKTIRKVELK